ncbi:hypothetical protein Tco_0951809 [Tanacetum coccineum]|uniref:Reverse transcriptase domain-containing protein n=1 Tax=Tanacetum coccineum TaxID=301880 RepID=A0ABQ5E177_9ASTR
MIVIFDLSNDQFPPADRSDFNHEEFADELTHTNFDIQTAGDHRKVQLNELNELRDQAYENSLIYKEKTKRIHDAKIKNRVFNVGDRVLLFNSRLKIFSGKLKSRWSGPFTIVQVFPYGTVELSQNSGPNFKVNGHRIKHYFGGDIPTEEFPDCEDSHTCSIPQRVSHPQLQFGNPEARSRNTKDMFLVYGGYVFVLNGGAVDWKSAKQIIFATSSAKAEYITAFDASKEAVWVRKFISRLGVVPTIEKPINMYCDNTGAIAIANESGIHYLRKVIEFGDIKLEKLHIYDNLADPFTKALAFPKHSELTRNIGMLPASSLIYEYGNIVTQGKLYELSATPTPKWELLDYVSWTSSITTRDMLKKFDLASVKTAITPMETKMALTKDEEADEVDVHLYRSMIGSLMYLTASRPDIMFAVCACSHFQATASLRVINEVPHIRATVAGKKILISEATIRADLLFDDADGVDCFPKQVIWDSLRDIGYEVLGVHTLELEDRTTIHMLAERRYPLSRELMIRMLDHGMEVEDESETAITLIHLFILWTTEDGDNS